MGCQARDQRLLGVAVLQLIKREGAALRQLDRASDRLRVAVEEPRHLVGSLQVTVGVALAAEANIVDRGVLADAGHHVLQHALVGGGEQHVVRRHAAHPHGHRHVGEIVEAKRIARPPAQGQRHVGPVAEEVREVTELGGAPFVRFVGDQHGEQAFGPGGQVLPVELAGGLARPSLAERQQPAEPSVGGAVGRIDQERRLIGEVEPATDHGAYARRLRRLVSPHDPGEAGAVADRQGLDPAQRRLGEQILRAGRATQEAEVRGDLQLGVAARRLAAHANRPCRNQERSPVWASSPSPCRYSQKRSPDSSSTEK